VDEAPVCAHEAAFAGLRPRRRHGRREQVSAHDLLVERERAIVGAQRDGAGRLQVPLPEPQQPARAQDRGGERLATIPYTGFTAGGETPIGRRAIQQAGFTVTVGGRRYGKGSSREHSPAAERQAGIRLVIAESFERIYRQNADNIGLFTSTDFSLLDRIERGEPIAIDDLLRDREPLAAAILRAGGLLRFGQRHLQSASAVPLQQDEGPLTLYGKIVRRHLLATPVTPQRPQAGEGCFVRADWRFIHEYYTGMAVHMLDTVIGRDLQLRDRDGIVVFEDHSSYVDESPAHLKAGLVPNMRAMQQAQRDFVERHALRCHRTLTDDEARADDGSNVAGISHAMMAERYALPGQLVAGTDSHTPHSGALGCLAFGVGTTDMANAFATGAVRMTVAPVLRVELEGTLPAGVMAKDVVLHLLAREDIRGGSGVGKVFEFAGAVVRAMSIDERATLTNMTAELGGMTGIVEPDQETVRFLQERRGIDFTIEPWMRSDPAAAYAQVIRVDCSALSPMVASPGDPGNGVPLASLQEPVRIDIAYGGSCTAGKREDFDAYHEVLAWGLAHGLRVPEHVQLYLQYGTTAVRDYCIARGYDRTFAAVGARILQPSCGACANCGPGSSTSADQVTVSAINRNFPGRSGPGQVWLANPATVMASALRGELCSVGQLREQKTIEHRLR
jgi:3-isopropylmalate/(R)-2-methylmalate dehydratase large subunit